MRFNNKYLRNYGFVFFITTIFIFSNFAFSENKAVINTVASDYSSGAVSVVSTTPPRTPINNIIPAISDTTISGYGKYFFRMIRGSVEVIEKYSIDSPAILIWDYSTLDSNRNPSNIYSIVFASYNKAYMMRFNSSIVWILDLSGNDYQPSLSNLKIGELDLSSYADQDGSCEPVCGVIVGDKIFIGLQSIDRSEGWENYVYNDSYLAVFDINTDFEIDTKKSTKKGILLPIKNISSIQYVASTNKIYAQGIGRYPSSSQGALYDGGIISIDPINYDIKMIVDDGNDDNHPYGNITGFTVISPQKGYFISYAGWGDNSCYIFNPENGMVAGVVPGLEHINISSMEGGAYLEQNKLLWISNSSDARIEILDTSTDTIVDSVSTGLNPQKIIFCTPDMPGTISGKILSENSPVQNARVYLTNNNIVAWTDENGEFLLRNVEAGIHEINADANNYLPVKIDSIAVKSSENTLISDIIIKPMSNDNIMGDSNHDGIVDLKDPIFSLQILTNTISK